MVRNYQKKNAYPQYDQKTLDTALLRMKATHLSQVSREMNHPNLNIYLLIYYSF